MAVLTLLLALTVLPLQKVECQISSPNMLSRTGVLVCYILIPTSSFVFYSFIVDKLQPAQCWHALF